MFNKILHLLNKSQSIMRILIIGLLSLFIVSLFSSASIAEDQFQGKAYYFSKSKMDLGRWGARLSEAQKKQIAERLKNRLEKTYILSFNKEASVFKEEEKIDAYSGATDSWGKNFSPGLQYKNVKTKNLLQKQEFYGKQFLIDDNLLAIDWKIAETPLGHPPDNCCHFTVGPAFPAGAGGCGCSLRHG